MTESLRVERSIWINASREKVWRAITDPVQIQQWFSPPTPWTLTALEIGGVLSPVGYEDAAGKIVVLDPPRRFAWVAESRPPDNLAITTLYILEEENGGTRVTVSESGFEPPETYRKRINDTNSGYRMALDNLKAFLEGRALPYPKGL